VADYARPARYAALWGERLGFEGDDLDDVIDRACEDLAEALACGHVEPDWVVAEPLIVHLSAAVCYGANGAEDCACGEDHEEGTWSLMAYARRVRVALSVGAPALDGDGYTVAPAHGVDRGRN